jgi:hypothetical protein
MMPAETKRPVYVTFPPGRSKELPGGIQYIHYPEKVSLRSEKRITAMSISGYIGLICLACLVFGSAATAESFCSRVETGSSMWLTAGTISTQMGSRFISASADAGTEVFNNVQVGEYAPGIPAQGSVSAFIKGRILQDGQVVEFGDSTSIIGSITSFSKSMAYNSQLSSLFC